MRKLATIRRIDNIEPIEGADAIDVATVGGWKVVVKKNEFSVNDLAVYLEIDSWVPQNIAPFLFKGRSYFNVPGERLRTVKLRGQVSQGLVLPLDVVIANSNGDYTPNEDDDVTELLGIQKWEAEIPAQLLGLVRGTFPSFIRKTDQERLQNLTRPFVKWRDEEITFEITEKLEGSSMTVYRRKTDDETHFGVCSRNLDLKESADNTFWKVARTDRLEEVLEYYGKNIALQGEMIGMGVQGNIYQLKDNEFHLFDIWDIDEQRYYTPFERQTFIKEMKSEGFNIKHVPVVGYDLPLERTVQYPVEQVTIEHIIEAAEEKSKLNPKQEREGIVFKSMDGNISFKCVSRKYLLKQKD